MLKEIKKSIDNAELKVLKKLSLRDYVGAIYKQAGFKVKKNIKHKGHKVANLMITPKDKKINYLAVIKEINKFPYTVVGAISEKPNMWYIYHDNKNDFYKMPVRHMKRYFEEDYFYSHALPLFNSKKLKEARETIKKKTLENKPINKIKQKIKKKFQKQTQDEDLEEEQHNN